MSAPRVLTQILAFELKLKNMRTKKVAVLIFDDVEVLDFCGPFEVFSVAGRWKGNIPFEAFTVAQKKKVRARGGLSINPT